MNEKPSFTERNFIDRHSIAIDFKMKAMSALSSTRLLNQSVVRALLINLEISDSRNTISQLAASPEPA